MDEQCEQTDNVLAAATAQLSKTRQRAIWNIGCLGLHEQAREERELAVWALVPMLEDPAPEVRYEAAVVLGRFGDARACKGLLKLIYDEDPPTGALIPQYGFRLLGKIALDPLVAAVADKRLWVRRRAITAIGYLVTVRSLWAAPDAVRIMRPYALDESEVAKAVSAIRSAAMTPDSETQRCAANALWILGHETEPRSPK